MLRTLRPASVRYGSNAFVGACIAAFALISGCAFYAVVSSAG